MREPREERTLRTIINLPLRTKESQHAQQWVFLGVVKTGVGLPLFFGVGIVPFFNLFCCIIVIAPVCNTKKLPQQPKQENQRSTHVKTRLNLKTDWTEELLDLCCSMYFKRQIYCSSILLMEIKTKTVGSNENDSHKNLALTSLSVE